MTSKEAILRPADSGDRNNVNLTNKLFRAIAEKSIDIWHIWRWNLMTHLGEGDVCCDLCGRYLRRDEAVEIINSKGWILHFCPKCDGIRKLLILAAEAITHDG